MRIHRWLGLSLFFVFLLSCASITPRHADLGPKLTKLTKAVESKVHYDPECASKMTERQLLYYAIAHDPELLEPFKNMKVRILQQNKHAILLICTKDGSIAFFEDAGCTPELDWTWNEKDPSRPCEFSLNVCE